LNKYFNKYYWIRKFFVNKLVSKFFSEKKLNKIIFNSIYRSNHWNKGQYLSSNQSYSGPGSASNSYQTQKLITNLENFFQKYSIKSILDAPCGDCAWIKEFFTKDFIYTGIDVVDDLITKNIENFGSNSKINFICKDITEVSDFDNYDFVLMRDFFIHLPFSQIKKILNNIKKSKCKYFAFNSYEKVDLNKEISIGQHRKLNFLKDPFNLGVPFYKFQEINNQNLPDEDNFIYIYENKN
jgi:hypothetical protein